MHEPLRWAPLLSNSSRDEALKVIDKISSDILSFDPVWRWHGELAYPSSLGFGDAGLALYFCYRAKILENNRAPRAAFPFLESALGAINREWLPYGFRRGGAGIYWVSSHLAELYPEHVTRADRHDYDIILARWCESSDAPLDFLDGLSGLFLYLSNHHSLSPSETMAPYLVNRILESPYLADYQMARPGADTIIYPDLKDVVAVVSSLLAIRTVGHTTFTFDGLLIRAVDRLLKEALSAWALLQNTVAPDGDITAKGLECLCIFVCLLNAARYYARDDWKVAALHAATRLAEWSINKQAWHSGLASGSTGFAHLFNRLFHASSNELFAYAARYWYSQAICRLPANGIGGFLAEGIPAIGLLYGTSGVALSLLAAISHTEPDWDQLLLWSLPSRRTATL